MGIILSKDSKNTAVKVGFLNKKRLPVGVLGIQLENTRRPAYRLVEQDYLSVTIAMNANGVGDLFQDMMQRLKNLCDGHRWRGWNHDYVKLTVDGFNRMAIRHHVKAYYCTTREFVFRGYSNVFNWIEFVIGSERVKQYVPYETYFGRHRLRFLVGKRSPQSR